jgi:hypothetical protein
MSTKIGKHEDPLDIWDVVRQNVTKPGRLERLKLKKYCEMCGGKTVLEPAFNPSGKPKTLCRACRIGSAELLQDRRNLAWEQHLEHRVTGNHKNTCSFCHDLHKNDVSLPADRYLVVSYNPDEQQWHYDTVFATTGDAAKTRILELRDYCIDADVFTVAELDKMTQNVKAETVRKSEKWLADLADERDNYENPRASEGGEYGGGPVED